MRIDLHTHSRESDGTDAPADLVAAAAATGLDVVALTDHDTTAGWDEARTAAQRLGLGFVPGIEVSCASSGTSVHLLAYGPDPSAPELVAELERARESRVHRARRMVDRLAADYPITWADVEAQRHDAATVGRPHIADALVAAGVAPTRSEVFASVLGTRSPYYVPHYAPDPVAAVRVVREAGGVPVMAHPRAGRRGRVVADDVVEAMARAGLAGLEVHHRDHEPDDVEHLLDLADALGLLVTGSSDYHGTGKENVLGERTTEPDALEALLAQVTGTPVLLPGAA